MIYLFVVLGKVSQLLVVETLNFVTSYNFFFAIIPLFLGGFLSHFLFWPLIGQLTTCATLIIFTFMVSCETRGVLAFVHGVIFHAFRNFHHLLIGYEDLTSLQDGIASPRLQVM